MKIRNYEESDRDSIIDLLRFNTPGYFSPDEEEDLIYYLNNHIESYFVAEDHQLIVGCCGYNLTGNPEVIGLSWDIVHPQYQGKGIGSGLTKFRIQRIRQMDGVKKISVRTSQLAYEFYEKFGFKLNEIIKDYWAAGFDLYNMELIIPDH